MKPVLFNTQMVKSILDGKKTVTRRCVKLPSFVKQQENGLYTLYADGTCYENQHMEDIQMYFKQPYKVDDVLYVRETWHKYIKRVDKGEKCHLAEFYGYKASIANSEDADEPWKPSIHMPKEAARIFLKVKSVRMERLQDIEPGDAIREGTKEIFPPLAVDEFRNIWNSTIKKTDLDTYGWNANPYVWVIEFERCDKPTE